MHTQGLRGLVLGRTQQSRDCPGVDEILQSALCDEIYMQVIMLLYFQLFHTWMYPDIKMIVMNYHGPCILE